jgi:SpoVK/Ycf46/Vps4 family AAA+-type ATPase
LISGEKYESSYNSNFPASKINTNLDWKDLILPYDTMKELKEVSIWLDHSKSILSHPQLSKIIKPGFRCLFYGPPGTGKTLTATLLGKNTGLDVYRIDLSMIVSKWVGETEKNLKGIFDQALNKNWILFFDEADSLFGKRTQTKSSNDRYANQEVAYLLQRIEDFPGLVVLATNMKDNIDEAFSRRFQSMVYFPNPDAETRLVLWKQSLPQDFTLEECIDLEEIADEHEVSGGTIINVVRHCVLMALSRGGKIIHEEDLEIGIMRELKKGGKIVG